MNENKFFVHGMLAMMLAFSLILAGCATTTNGGSDGGEPYDSPKTIKITGYTSESGITVYDIKLQPELNKTAMIGFKTISDLNLTYELLNGRNDLTPWTGVGKFFIMIECQPPKDPAMDGSQYVYSLDGTNPALIDIRDEITVLEWTKFIWFEDNVDG
jgi:hypothetical protein